MSLKRYLILFVLTFMLFSCKKDDKSTQLPIEIETVKSKLSASFDTLNTALSTAAIQLAQSGIDTTLVRARLASMFAASTCAKEFAYITKEGILQIIEPPAYYADQGIDISTQPHVIKAFQTKQPVLSDVFWLVEGFWSVVDLHPIYNTTELYGGIDAVVAPQELLGRIILPIVKNQSFEIWVMEKTGMVLFDQDTAEIGLNVITDPMYAAFPELITACQKMASEESGVTSYSFYQTGTNSVVTKKTYWDTFSLYGNEWKIVWVKPE